MQLNFQAPTTLKTHITNVPALQLTLTPQAPETSTAVIVDVPLLSVSLTPQAPQTLKTSITSVPALDIALTPQAPSTLRSLITDVPTRNLTLTPQAPETTHTVPGTNITDVPLLSFSLSPQAPTSTATLITPQDEPEGGAGGISPVGGRRRRVESETRSQGDSGRSNYGPDFYGDPEPAPTALEQASSRVSALEIELDALEKQRLDITSVRQGVEARQADLDRIQARIEQIHDERQKLDALLLLLVVLE